MNDKNILISISSGTIVRFILFMLLFWLMYFFTDLLLVILTAVVIASSVEPAIRFFEKYKIPRVVSVIGVYLMLAAVIVGVVFLFVPPILDEASSFLSTLPDQLNSLSLIGNYSVSDFSLNEIITNFKSTITGTAEGFWAFVSGVFGGISSFFLIILLSIYFSFQEYGITNFLKIITPTKHEKYIIDLWKRSQRKIGLWMQGQLLLALIIGVLVYLGLTILGVKYALLLAILAAFAELVPVVGPVLAAIPAIAIAFTDGGTSLGFMVVAFYIIIQQFENHLMYPLVVNKVVGVPPLLVILGLIIGAKLFGFLGILLSVPVAAALMEFVKDVEKNKNKILNEGK